MAKEEVKFEDKLNELEKIVLELEKGDVDLDDAIEKLKSAEENVNKILTDAGKELDFKVDEEN